MKARLRKRGGLWRVMFRDGGYIESMGVNGWAELPEAVAVALKWYEWQQKHYSQ